MLLKGFHMLILTREVNLEIKVFKHLQQNLNILHHIKFVNHLYIKLMFHFIWKNPNKQYACWFIYVGVIIFS